MLNARAARLALLALSVTALPAPDATAQSPAPTPPVAAVRPHVHARFGVERSDPYYWLREREDPAVVAYLNAENAYTAARTERTVAPLAETIYGEIVGRIQQDDASAPVRQNGYAYQTRYAEGKQYPVYVRHRDAPGAPEEVLLDGNARAEGHAYWAGWATVSDDNRLAAVSEDVVSRRLYTVRFRDLATGAWLPDVIEATTGSVAWDADGKSVLYVRKNPETLRGERAMRHVLGTPASADAELFYEADEEFDLALRRARSRRYTLVVSSQTEATEVRLVDSRDPNAAVRVFQPRTPGLDYDVDHVAGAFYVRSNLAGASNYRLSRVLDTGKTGVSAWETVVDARDDVLLEDFKAFDGFVVTQEREGGLTRLRVRGTDGSLRREVAFDDPAYTVALAQNPEPGAPVVRYVYASMTTPSTFYDEDLATGARTLVKRTPVLGGYDPARYVSDRLWATATDGTRIPISLVRRRDTPLDGTAPTLLYGYGSYGHSMDAGFSTSLPSLLDRGFVFAIAHVRGGQEMGRQWYEQGRLAHKMNTFTDFIAAGEHLVTARVADPQRLYAQGGSAGGLLMGAVVNLRPDLFKGVHAAVPFVDVVTTMLDASIPLTTFEYDEWGNPNEEAAFRTMLAYSPLDNVGTKPYPPMLVTTGLHDSQVQYWEPAKWVAKLRAFNGGAPDVLLKTNMDAGHGGASGRFARYREVAFEYAWFVDLATRRR